MEAFMTGVMALRRRPRFEVAGRVALMTAAALAVALAHRVGDPGILCPVRRFTGIPCPFCGGTTVFIELGSGHPVRALAANPLVFVGAFVFAFAPLGPAARWWALKNRTRNGILTLAIATSGIWQLARFGIL
ncbi:DUF2752 domain-containing protein [Actinocorallia longicatena]|uniref:DUF2752 domain-containing protein n=1 Tax=Actinocorallia longicatena TaxID=111803 RepID=A0ABP6QAW8_9ACTN